MSDHTISYDEEYGKWVVHEFGVYPKGSVLEGQTRKRFLNWYSTKEEAQSLYPNADVGHRSAHNTFNHLPGENDPVPGGMYPDDYDG